MTNISSWGFRESIQFEIVNSKSAWVDHTDTQKQHQKYQTNIDHNNQPLYSKKVGVNKYNIETKKQKRKQKQTQAQTQTYTQTLVVFLN